jgi:ATP-binding cassette subfamily F protein 3
MNDRVKQVVSGVLEGKGLDGAIVDYICGVLEDDTLDLNDIEGLHDVIAPILLDSGCAGDEKDSFKLCKEICTQMKCLSVGSHSTRNSDTFTQLSKPVHMATQTTVLHLPDFEKPASKPTYVDQKQIEKIDAKRKMKLEKKQQKDEMKAAKEGGQLATSGSSTSPVTSVEAQGSGHIRDIKIENINLSYGKLELIVNSSLTLAYGRKYGLIGRNGSGKSTLMRSIASKEFKIPSNLSILHVEQEMHGDDTLAVEAVLRSDTERTRLLDQEKTLLLASKEGTDQQTAAKLKQVYEKMEQIDAHTAESRAAAILAGLSFTPEMQRRPTKDFSGGWRMRISLAAALFRRPDVLLLDEPTNHLDLFAILWLENYLQSWKGTLLIVSHQRDFLNSVVTDILHLHSKQLVYYKGTYDDFERVRGERLRQQLREHEAQQMQRKHIQAFIDRFRYNAKRASMAQSRIKKLEKMVLIAEPETDGPGVKFLFPNPDRVPPPILQFTDVSFNYPGQPSLFRDLNIGIDMDSRVALVGPNGVGKSTLMQLLAGELQPTAGQVVRNGKVRWARFSQHFVDQLDLSMTPLQAICKTFPTAPVQDLRSHLGSFGISGDLALKTMILLSGGQKSRVAMATVAWRKPHLLLLDEPSNHLDIESIEALAQGLNAYEGGVMLVSHDERLISLVCDELWVLENQTVSTFAGDFDQYKMLLQQTLRG